MQINLKNKFNPKVLFGITILLFLLLYVISDYFLNDIGSTFALAKLTLFLVFGLYFLYLFICYMFVYVRMKIRNNRSKKNEAIRKEEAKAKEEKYRQWYKETYDD